MCEATCGLELHLEGKDITLVRGDRDDVFSHGFLCPKGTALKQLESDPDRLRQPQVRRGDSWHEVSWDDAFAEVERGLTPIFERYGRDAVAMYMGNPNVHNLAGTLYSRVLIQAVGLVGGAKAPAGLRLEPGPLDGGVVELRIGGGDLHPRDDQLQVLGEARVGAVGAGQRRDVLGEVHDEGRLDQRVLHLLLVDLHQELAPGPGGVVGHAQALALRRQVAVGVGPGLPDQVDQPGPGEGRLEVHLAVVPGQPQRARHRPGDVPDELLQQVRHVEVVGECLVGLEHRELGVVLGRDALVAEVAVDLEDPLEAADQEPLEVQLGGDPQVQVHAEGLVVGDEGPGEGPARNGLQHGGLDLDEAPLRQPAADLGHRLRA